MIHAIRNVVPAIDFGHGITTKEITAGQPVIVWLQTIYNRQAYDFMLQCGGSVNKISDYEYAVTFATPGSYALKLVISSKDKSITLQSNILNLTVTEQNG